MTTELTKAAQQALEQLEFLNACYPHKTATDAADALRRALAQRPAAQEREVDIKSRVSELIAEHGTLRAAARSLNIDVGYLSRLEHGDKVHPSSETLAKIGLRDVGVKYQRLVFLPTQQATPERHLTVTTNRHGDAVMVSWQDDEHRILEVVWERDQATPAPVGEPTFAQLKQILNGLDRCHARDSKAEFLRVWIRDWAQHKIEQATRPAPGVPEGFALVPMTEDQVWHNDSIMSANAIGGLKMEAVMRIVRGVEAHHSERLTVRMNGG